MTRRVLVPGLRVLERSRDELQIGLGPEHRLRVRGTPAVRRALARVERGEAPGPREQAALAALDRVLVDADALAPADIAPGDVAAAALADPAGFMDVLARRRTRSVAVLGTLPGDSAHADPRPLLEAAGLRVSAETAVRRPDAVLLVGAGEQDRAVTDVLAHDGVPHLLLRLLEGTVLIGPLVVPGRTACLRCLDAHHGDQDPQHPLLVALHQQAGRRDGVAEPADSALVALGVAWAVRDLVTHLDGGRAVTWSATVRVGPDLAALQVQSWLRHPACSCVWSAEDPPSSTMVV